MGSCGRVLPFESRGSKVEDDARGRVVSDVLMDRRRKRKELMEKIKHADDRVRGRMGSEAGQERPENDVIEEASGDAGRMCFEELESEKKRSRRTNKAGIFNI